MKILALQGSPRLRGNTAILLSQFVNGARADAEKLRALIEKLDASAAAMKK